MSLFALWLLWSGHYTIDFQAFFGPADEAGHAAEEGGHAAGEGGHAAEEGGHAPVNLLLLALGILSCVGVAFLCRGMGIVDEETVPVHQAPRVLRYLPWLAWQVVQSTLEVVRHILRPRDDDRPETVVVEGSQRTDIGKATYANSITLTPGTVTIDVTGSTFTVLALTPAAAKGVRSGEMDRQVARTEGCH